MAAAVVHHPSSSRNRKSKRKAASVIIPGKSLVCNSYKRDDARCFSAVKSGDVKAHLAEQLTGRANSTLKKPQNKTKNTRETNELQQSSSLPSTTKRLSLDTTDSSALSQRRDGRTLKGDAIWQGRLNDLRDYKKEFGDCLVPYRYKGHRRLGLWVTTQRQLYKKSLLRKDRTEALEAEGFVWCLVKHTPFKHRLLEFIAYREIYGTCSVPQDFPSYQEFGNWVHTTRKEYIKLRDGKPSQLTLDRFEALDAEGFIWVEEEHLPWRERFLQLVEFKKQFGHCNVSYPTHDCKALARWVRYQRDEYWKHYVGEESVMTREKIEELDKIGFDWCSRVT